VVVELLIAINIEIRDHCVEVVGLELSEPVFLLKLAKRKSVNDSIILPVDPLERGVRLELLH
jgi:hypothetical protein